MFSNNPLHLQSCIRLPDGPAGFLQDHSHSNLPQSGVVHPFVAVAMDRECPPGYRDVVEDWECTAGAGVLTPYFPEPS